MEIYLSNNNNKKQLFIPIKNNTVKIYACGPTVYEYQHIGNGRSMVTFDILYRLLKNFYNVKYVRNITDVDDKIIDRSIKNNEKPYSLTRRMIKIFHEDMKSLNCLEPNYEPTVTEHIQDILHMITLLINKGHAYQAEQHIYFAINSYNKYGKLFNRCTDKLQPRIDRIGPKKNCKDFVLWKPRTKKDNIWFESPWGQGRPGWHIECSAMSKKYLGSHFDIHCGGSDLIFPHHENENAQSTCSSQQNQFVNYWIHSGLVTINEIKMSKKLKNFITIRDIIAKGFRPIDLRCFYIKAHYRQQINFTYKNLDDAKKTIDKIAYCIQKYDRNSKKIYQLTEEFLEYIRDDLNTPKAMSYIHGLIRKILNGKVKYIKDLISSTEFLGILPEQKIQTNKEQVEILAKERENFRKKREWYKADQLRVKIEKLGYKITDQKTKYELFNSD